jgi:hypothetical protein
MNLSPVRKKNLRVQNTTLLVKKQITVERRFGTAAHEAHQAKKPLEALATPPRGA